MTEKADFTFLDKIKGRSINLHLNTNIYVHFLQVLELWTEDYYIGYCYSTSNILK